VTRGPARLSARRRSQPRGAVAARRSDVPTLDAVKARALIAAARRARARAYAPYSRFTVGAAVLDERGRIHAGCNVENASYGLTVCAERNAVAAAVAAGARRIAAVAVVTGADPAAPPCGACRQVLAELGTDNTPVLLAPPRAALPIERWRLGALLPRTFRLGR
jgi:cytidine deaminase